MPIFENQHITYRPKPKISKPDIKTKKYRDFRDAQNVRKFPDTDKTIIIFLLWPITAKILCLKKKI